MGVYIPDWEKPEHCMDCAFECAGGCVLKRKECPLIPVPPHGRLGDLDALHEMFQWAEKEKGYTACSMEQIYDTLGDAPTIIPADTE